MAKVFDVFPFFNEMDLLEIRLNELDSVVDYFVIAEAREMHGSARPKELILAENWDRFAPFWNKIIYRPLTRLLPEYTDARSGWMRENYQRDSLMAQVRAISKSTDDIVLVSDCDEIPRARTIKRLLEGPVALSKLQLDFFYYNVNSYVGPWAHSTIGTLAQYEAHGGFEVTRGKLDMPTPVRYPVILNAGWHFSYFGGLDRIRFKMENFAHSSDGFVKEALERKTIIADIRQRKDLYHRAEMQQFEERSSNDSSLPAYFLNNKERFAHFTEEGAR